MNHQGTKTLHTKWLLLRKFTLADAPFMFENWARDDDVTKYLTWPTHKSAQASEYILNEWIKQYQNENCYQWAIVLKEIDEPIGCISVVELNDQVSKAQIGYCIGKKWWRQGIMSESLKAVMDFLFDEVGVNRIEARHDVRNAFSGKVMQKCGMKYEGTHLQSDYNNQGVCDTAWYALLRKDR